MSLPLARRGWLALLIAMAAITPVSTSFGATYTWTGTGSGNNWFQTNGTQLLNSNWDSPGPGLTLGSADTVVFGTSAKTTANINNASAVSITGLVFGSGAPAYTITGGNGGSTLAVSGSVVNNSTNLQSINGAGTFIIGNGLVFDTASGDISIGRTQGSSSSSSTKQGAGTLFLGSAGSYTGTMSVVGGTLNGNGNSFGGSLVNSSTITSVGTLGGNFTQTGGASSISTITGSSSISGGTSDVNTFGGQVTISTATVTAQNLNDFSFVTTGGVLKLNTGGLIAQDITVNGGYLTGGTPGTGAETGESVILISGTADVVGAKDIQSTGGVLNLFNNGLSGTSVPSSLGSVTNIVGPVGANYTFGAPLTLASTGNLKMDLDTTGLTDNLAVNGGITYGGTLSLSMATSGTAANLETWNLFILGVGTTASGTLAAMTLDSPTYGNLAFGLSTSSTDYFDQKYGPGVWLSDWSGGQRFIFNQANGTLTIVPEPSTFVFAGIGAAMVGWHTWTRGRRKARLKLIEEHTRKLGVERGLV